MPSRKCSPKPTLLTSKPKSPSPVTLPKQVQENFYHGYLAEFRTGRAEGPAQSPRSVASEDEEAGCLGLGIQGFTELLSIGFGEISVDPAECLHRDVPVARLTSGAELKVTP